MSKTTLAPLLLAAKERDEAHLKQLLSKLAHVDNVRDHELNTALHWAAWGGCVGCIRALLKAGADINARNVMRETPLITCAPYRPSSVRALIAAGADLEARDRDEYTALMMAAKEYTATQSVKLLIEAGADVNANRGGYTALMYAVVSQGVTVVKYLIEAGADVNARNEDGRRAIQYLDLEPRPTHPTAAIEVWEKRSRKVAAIRTLLLRAGAHE